MDEVLQFCIYSFLQLKDNGKYDEASSIHVMIQVMIYGSEGCEGNKKVPAGVLSRLPVLWISD
jgi:hypothetical protein